MKLDIEGMITEAEAEVEKLASETTEFFHPVATAVKATAEKLEAAAKADVKVFAADLTTVAANGIAKVKAAVPGLAAEGVKELDQLLADFAAAVAAHGITL